ncbi:hypothetical protein ACLKA7_015130 [Drosophila subpalustris]
MQKVYNVPWSDVIRDFHALVDGRARDWFWTHVRTATILDWPNLRYCLEQHFQSRKSSFEQEQDLRERKQRPGESIDDYLQEMISLRSRLPTPFSDHDLIKTIKINIRDGISRVIYPMAISNLEKLRDECHEAERWLATRWTKPAQPLLPPKVPRHHVQEAYVPVTEPNAEEEEEQSVEALYRPREGGGNLTCWNCSQAGHTFWDCESTERTIFCYKCGLAGTVFPKCTRCQQGNHRRSKTQAEESRSNPAGTN